VLNTREVPARHGCGSEFLPLRFQGGRTSIHFAHGRRDIRARRFLPYPNRISPLVEERSSLTPGLIKPLRNWACVKAVGQSFYHCVSRAVERRFILHTSGHGSAEAERFVAEQNGELSLPERLRCRIRYFSDGVILGCQSFVESHFDNLKQKLGYKRQRTRTPLTALAFSDRLWVFRDPRVRPIG
jgi:hypothetical protein